MGSCWARGIGKCCLPLGAQQGQVELHQLHGRVPRGGNDQEDGTGGEHGPELDFGAIGGPILEVGAHQLSCGPPLAYWVMQALHGWMVNASIEQMDCCYAVHNIFVSATLLQQQAHCGRRLSTACRRRPTSWPAASVRRWSAAWAIRRCARSIAWPSTTRH